MTDNVSKIKERLDIVEVVGSYVKLQKAGVNYKGRCPFHNEKTPSFFVTPDRQIWHCFGCAKGGDMFAFIQEIEGVEFPEALKILAGRAGIELETFRPQDAYKKDEKARLFEICELAVKFFQKQFESTTGKRAVQYLVDRGLTMDTIREFRLGFAPNDWEALSTYLQRCGYGEEEIVNAGMAIRSEKKRGIYDRFRSRIMFPITDIAGQTVGFTGRVFESSPDLHTGDGHNGSSASLDHTPVVMAKYVNTPQTLIYDKSRVLYGLSQAKLDIKKADRCILVEGNMDALMSFQGGVRNVVASSGTALTPHHLRLLQRYTKNLGFCFDTDQAGAAATKRGIGLALAQQFNITVLAIEDKECKDPADYVRKHGPGWSALVASAKPVIDYYFDKARSTYNPTSADSKKTVIATVAPFIKRLTSNVERSHWIGQLSALLQVPQQVILADLANTKDEFAQYAEEVATVVPAAAVVSPVTPPDALNEAILSVVLRNPILAKEPDIPYQLINPETAEIIAQIAATETFSFATFVNQFTGPAAMHLEFANLRAQELWQEFSPEELREQFYQLLNTLRRRSYSSRLASLQFDLKEAERLGNRERIIQLVSEFNTIAQQLTIINGSQEKNQKDELRQSPDGKKGGQETDRQEAPKETGV